MFELIGFWTSLTFLILFTLGMPLYWFCYLTGTSLAYQITQDSQVKEKVSQFFYHYEAGKGNIVFNRINLGRGGLDAALGVGGTLLSTFFWVFYLCAAIEGPATGSLVDDFVSMSKVLTPVFTYIGPVVIAYFSIIFVGRKLYKLTMTVSRLAAKLEKEE